MAFERTVNGQSNRAIFLDVDYVCYVEGEDLAEFGDDVVFWNAVFAATRGDLKVRFTSRGSKAVLERLANEIVDNNIQNTIVAMDADFTRHFGRDINDRRVMYTFGYSWENDVVFIDHANQCCAIAAKRTSVTPACSSLFRNYWSNFNKKFYRITKADFLAMARTTSVVPRESPGRLVIKDANAGVGLKLDQAIILIRQAKQKAKLPPRPYLTEPTEPNVDLTGKLVKLAARYITNAVNNKLWGQKEIGADLFDFIAIENFEKSLRIGLSNKVLDHYRDITSRI